MDGLDRQARSRSVFAASEFPSERGNLIGPITGVIDVIFTSASLEQILFGSAVMAGRLRQMSWRTRVRNGSRFVALGTIALATLPAFERVVWSADPPNSACRFVVSDEPDSGPNVAWISPSSPSSPPSPPSPPSAPAPSAQLETPSECKTCYGVCRHPGHPRKPLMQRAGDINCKDCPLRRYQQCDHCRAGFPGDVAKWAAGSQPACYSASYVGGGAVLVGRPRGDQEGTWGRDYHGLLCPESVFLWWTCGRRQGGEGAYQTDHEHVQLVPGLCLGTH